jgi:hypothetical protein
MLALIDPYKATRLHGEWIGHCKGVWRWGLELWYTPLHQWHGLSG